MFSIGNFTSGMSLTQTPVDGVSEDLVVVPNYSLDRVFKGDGKEKSLGCFPSLMSPISSNELGGLLQH